MPFDVYKCSSTLSPSYSGGYQQSKVSDQKQGSSFYPPAVPKTPTNSGYPSAVGGSKTTSPSQRNIFPITSINPYQSRWTIRARVTTKPPMKTYHNSRGEGRLFSMDLVDESVSLHHKYVLSCNRFKRPKGVMHVEGQLNIFGVAG